MPLPDINAIPKINPALLRFFSTMTRRNLRQSFRALRVAHAERMRHRDAPLIVVVNHPSWWDPITCLLLAEELMPKRNHFAPMSATPLKRFPIMSRIGMFPIEPGTPSGAKHFLKTSRAILTDVRNVLWLTPQGRFADARERPLQIARGVGALLSRYREATVQPIALEYSFWNERQPEALALVGEPFFLTPSDKKDADALTLDCATSLQTAQDELAQLVQGRDASAFKTILEGKHGTRGVYGLWQAMLGRVPKKK